MSDLLFQVLLPMCLTGCLFALGVLLVFPLLRRLSARWRRAALLATVTLFILPLPLLFAAQPAQATAQDTQQPTLNQTLQQAAPTAPVYQAGQALNTATRPQQATGDAEAGKGPAVSLPQTLTLVYLAGFGLYVAATGLRYLLFVRRLRRGCTPAAPQSREAALLAALCEEMDIRRPPGLYHSEAFSSPVLAGLLRPRIVLPADPASASQCEWALRHELTHYKQRDLPAKAFVLAVSAVYWWCPALPALRRAFSLACEDTCDERVAANLSSGERKEYAGTLLHFAGGSLPYATAGLALPIKNLRRRLQRLMRPVRPSRMLQAVGLTLLAVVLCVGLLIGCSFAAGATAPSDLSSSAPPSSVPSSSLPASSMVGAGADAPLTWPLPGYTEASRGFEGDEHPGLDIPAPTGTPIYACAEGTVTAASYDDAYGLYVTIDHGDGLVTLYAHCSSLYVSKDGTVGSMQLIAAVGDTSEAAESLLYLEVQKDSVAVSPLDFMSIEPPTPVDPSSLGFIWPLSDWSGIIREFKGTEHRGVDIEAPEGSPVYATASGTVIEAGFHWSYGNYIMIDHGDNVISLYAHCSTLYVQEAQVVEQNDIIADSGSTGVAARPHLHFEVLVGGVQVDPMLYVSPPGSGNSPSAPVSVSASGYAWPVPDCVGMSRGFLGSAHNGLDINAPVDSSVLACAAGKVEKAEYHWSYGNSVVLRHSDGMRTLYAHCAELYVKPGDIVEQGDVIATVGSTGVSTGPHTHVEFILEEEPEESSASSEDVAPGTRVDPLGYLTPPPSVAPVNG